MRGKGKYRGLSPRQVRPGGWLARQMQIQAEGRQKRREAEAEMLRLENELKSKPLQMQG